MIDLDQLIGSFFKGKGQSRFDQGPWPQQVKNPLDISDPVIQDMIARAPAPWHIETLNLGTAGEKLIQVPGFHFVIYGHDNSANKAVNTTALVNVYWGIQKNQSNPFPAKHARGISAPFQGLYLTWPAQSNVYCDVVVYTGMYRPYIDGESCT